MTKKIITDFNSNVHQLLQKIGDRLQNEQNVSQLQINNIAKIVNLIELITQEYFKSEIILHKSLTSVIFKINEEFDEKYIEDHYINKFVEKQSFLFIFQSIAGTHCSKIFWKVPEKNYFYSIFIDDDVDEDVSSFLQEFLTNELSNERTGILEPHQSKTKIRIHEIGDEKRRNLLDLAVQSYDQNVTKKLLKYEFDMSDAVNHAWSNYIHSDNELNKNKANKILLILLKSNSTFPIDFKYELASKKVQEFVDFCENIHNDIKDNKLENLGSKLDEYPDMIYFYNRNNQTLLANALKMRNYDILKFLEKGITISPHEDIEEVYKNIITDKVATLLRFTHRQNSNENPESHILTLRFKSRIGNNDQFSTQKWSYINEAYDNLNSNEYCSLILKVAAECKNLIIYFDFKHDSTYYMDPATSIFSRGVVYEGGSIFIGAKNLVNDDMKFEVFGVLIHELCHLAVYMAFMNPNFDPFSIENSKSKERKRFRNKVMDQCKMNQDSEILVSNVFDNYPESIQCSEMIVVAAQMMICYQNDQERIKNLKNVFSELFKYCEQVVEPELNRALPILKLLWSTKSVKFEDLTKPMKAKIWHSKINFQGVKTTFFNLLGIDDEILNHISSEDIKDVLLKNSTLKIGEASELDLKYELSERSFINRDIEAKLKKIMPLGYKQELDKYSKKFEDIEIEAKSKQIMILADFAGTGKTTIFKYYAKKLKTLNECSWISFINLRKCQEILENFDEICTEDHVFKVFLQILNLKSELEVKIFTKLFDEGNVIFLLDGFDEVSPRHAESLRQIFKI